MTSSQQHGLSSDRIRGSPKVDVTHLECLICHQLLWKPVACKSCEIPFCSSCIYQWLANNPKQCPNRCQTYIERKCPPIVTKLLAEIQVACFYESNGCNQVISYEGLDKHEIECGFQFQQCPGCKSQIFKKDFDNHHNQCPSIELTCQDCKLVYKRNDTDRKHTDIICLKKQLQYLRHESKHNKCKIKKLDHQLKKTRILKPMIKKTKVTFNDLPEAITGTKWISNIYNGLHWTYIYYANELYWKKMHPKSGYITSLIPGSSPNIAYFKDSALITVGSPNTKFTFVSVTACAAWKDDLELTITGHRNFIEINTHTTKLLFGKLQFILLYWEDVDKIMFKSSGGTAHPLVSGHAGSDVVLNQVTICSLR
ncbi:unnamed protein product [Rotaria sp. Silwood1]|nr:unnamed protein product [Rotaria sp. Silwood1]CAF1279610.1 unnamed protein product [Rotaria sp. Silwood1]